MFPGDDAQLPADAVSAAIPNTAKPKANDAVQSMSPERAPSVESSQPDSPTKQCAQKRASPEKHLKKANSEAMRQSDRGSPDKSSEPWPTTIEGFGYEFKGILQSDLHYQTYNLVRPASFRNYDHYKEKFTGLLF